MTCGAVISRTMMRGKSRFRSIGGVSFTAGLFAALFAAPGVISSSYAAPTHTGISHAKNVASAPAVIAPPALPGLLAVWTASPPALAHATLRPAPMPDLNSSAPVGPVDDSTHVAPALFHEKIEYQGDGFTGTNDHARDMQPAAGVRVNVPLN